MRKFFEASPDVGCLTRARTRLDPILDAQDLQFRLLASRLNKILVFSMGYDEKKGLPITRGQKRERRCAW
jgi:hypothetical protein